MLWGFGTDSDKGKVAYDVVKEINKAYLYFIKKYDSLPDICMVALDSEISEDVLTFGDCKIRISKNRCIFAKNTLLIGLSESDELRLREEKL